MTFNQIYTKPRRRVLAVTAGALGIVIICSPGAASAAVGGVDPSFSATILDKGTVIALAQQPDGKVIVGGTFSLINGVLRDRLARLNPDGSLDESFNAGPLFSDTVQAIAVQADGKILVAAPVKMHAATSDFSNDLVRLNSDGSLDTTFFVELANSNLWAISVLPNGQILVGGAFTNWGQTEKHRLVRLNADGSLDQSFVADFPGQLIADISVFAITRQPDGKILVGGNFPSRLVRLNPNGTGDSTFNSGGAGPGGVPNPFIVSIALQADGKILIGGRFFDYNGTTRYNFARVNSDGSLDTAFNNGDGLNSDGVVHSVVLQPDGKSVIGGDFFSYNKVIGAKVARINDDGTLDSTFNAGQGIDNSVFSLLLQGDGHLIIGGTFDKYDPSTQRIGLAKLSSTGSVDAVYKPAAAVPGSIRKIVVQPDKKILVGGDFVAVNGAAVSNFARLNQDGSIDSAFLTGGTDSTVFAITLQADGKIYLGGAFQKYNGSVLLFPNFVRVNANGSRDTTFNLSSDGGSLATNGPIHAILLQPDGKIVFAGEESANPVRINTDGSLDPQFLGNVGFGADAVVRDLVLQPDGKILLAGDFSQFNKQSRASLARLNPNGSLDSTFDPGNSHLTTINSIALQTDGKIIAGGRHGFDENGFAIAMRRFNDNGTLDSSFDVKATLGITDTCDADTIYQVAALPDGKVMFAADVLHSDCLTFFARSSRVYRVIADGSADPSYISGIGTNTAVFSFALQPDGELVLGGAFSTYNTVPAVGLARLFNQPLLFSGLLNISTRLNVLTADKVLIGGLIITGNDPKTVLFRAIGPSLSDFGVTGALGDPILELHDSTGALIAFNDNWKQNQEDLIGSSLIPPRNLAEAAVIKTLMPGSYTAIVRGNNNTTGIALVEAYDLDNAADSRLGNISTRGFVDLGDNAMIGGFIVAGKGGSQRVIVRAIGPSLSNLGVSGALEDPTLELHDGSGTTIASNDNWKLRPNGTSQQAEIEATTIPPKNDLESAIVQTLAPGNYTAVVRGKNNTTGIALVEAYNLQ